MHPLTTDATLRPLASKSLAVFCLSTFPALASASCGADFCSVNSLMADNVAFEPGSSFDLRYEYIRQDQPRAGRDKVALGQLRRHHDEVETRNNNLLATFSHQFDAAWGLSLTIPMVDRQHHHIHNHHGAQFHDRWNFTELGDISLVGRYQASNFSDTLRPSSSGFSFGLKLPTGQTDVRNGEGALAERSLQPGSGTTDLIVGAYYQQSLPALGAAWFTQLQYQRALAEHEGFAPGHQLRFDLGYRQQLGERLSGLIQLNVVTKARNDGAEAEPADSGGQFAALSPGLSYAIGRKTQIYAFVQVPLAQYVNGVQLTADQSFVAGWSGHF